MCVFTCVCSRVCVCVHVRVRVRVRARVHVLWVYRSTARRPVRVRLVRPPAHGHLVDPATGLALRNGSRLATASVWPYEAPLRVTYRGNPGYFNSPDRRFNGSALPLDEGAG